MICGKYPQACSEFDLAMHRNACIYIRILPTGVVLNHVTDGYKEIQKLPVRHSVFYQEVIPGNICINPYMAPH